MPYFVYLLECGDGSLYTGITTDVERRLAEHKSGVGSNFTRAKGAKRIVYAEGHPDRSAAQKREAEIKKWSRAKKLSLVEKKLPTMYNEGMRKKGGVVIYQARNGAIEFRGDTSRETIWATQAQIAEVFGVERSVVTKHLRNVLKDKELEARTVCAKFAHTAADGKTYQVEHYNLDAIISVGYRVNSKTATQFRQWATKTLRGYVINGYMINKRRIAKNYEQFMAVMEDIKRLLPAGSATESKDVVELISLFADTWLSLDAYDKESFPKGKLTKKIVKLTANKITDNLIQLKRSLLNEDQATEIFAHERTTGSIEGIVGNVMQSFGGKELYPTAEEKAAHLLYFMVKNHPFVDGNKRSGAFSFVWFLRQAGILDTTKLTPSALTALTIMVAESSPEHKEKVVRLILNLVSK